MSESINQSATYSDRLAALASAAADTVEVAYTQAQDAGFTQDGAEVAYVNLWDAMLNALIAHADCDHADLLGIVAGTLQMDVVVPVVQVPAVRVPVIGTIGPDGRVSWNSGA